MRFQAHLSRLFSVESFWFPSHNSAPILRVNPHFYITVECGILPVFYFVNQSVFYKIKMDIVHMPTIVIKLQSHWHCRFKILENESSNFWAFQALKLAFCSDATPYVLWNGIVIICLQCFKIDWLEKKRIERRHSHGTCNKNWIFFHWDRNLVIGRK